MDHHVINFILHANNLLSDSVIAFGIYNPYCCRTNALTQTTRYTDPQITTTLTRISAIQWSQYRSLDTTKYLKLYRTINWEEKEVNWFIQAFNTDIGYWFKYYLNRGMLSVCATWWTKWKLSELESQSWRFDVISCFTFRLMKLFLG